MRTSLLVVLGLLPTAARGDDLHREVTRLFASAAGHATRSNACVDGSGSVAHVTNILTTVDPKPGANGERIVRVRYETLVDHEGDTRGAPAPVAPAARVPHVLALRFAPVQQKFSVVVPAEFPGLQLLTPMTQRHDTRCYGTFGPWTSKLLALP